MSKARRKKRRQERQYTPEALEAMRQRAAHMRSKKKNLQVPNISGVSHATQRDAAGRVVHIPNETAAPDYLLKREMSLPYSETMTKGLPPQVMSVANIEAIWAAGEPTHGLETQVPDYTEQDEDERKPLMQTPVESYSEVCCTCELTITKLVGNPRILIASTPLLAGEQHVIVGNSENFIIGMKILVIRNPPNPAYWLLNGPLPRSRGRW